MAYYLEEGVSVETVSRWASGLDERFEGLTDHPKRFVVDEPRTQALGYEVRRLVHDEYLVFYRVDDDRSVVEVLDFRHGRRQPTTDMGA